MQTNPQRDFSPLKNFLQKIEYLRTNLRTTIEKDKPNIFRKAFYLAKESLAVLKAGLFTGFRRIGTD